MIGECSEVVKINLKFRECEEPGMYRIALRASKRENSVHRCPETLEDGE